MTRYSVFGHRQTANSLEKSLMLGMIEGRRRRGHWRRRCLNGITDAMDLNLSKLQETVRDREAWCDTVHVFAKSQTWLGNWKTTTVCKQQHTHKTQRTPESLDRRLFLHYVHGKGNVYSGQLIHRKEHKLRKDTQKCSSISTQHRSVYDIPSQSVEMNFLLLFTFIVVLIQVLSPVWLFLTPWTTTCQAPLSSTISQSLHKFRSIKSVILPNYLILWCPLLFLTSFFSIRVFSNESALLNRWPKYWNFSFKYQFFQWIFRVDFL